MSHEKLGFWSVFAVVTGSQIGTGILVLPSSLAPFGLYSFAGWAASMMGAIALAGVFATLCSRIPHTGGPHAYVNAAFGKCMSFFTGWTYWVISWISSTAVIVASIGYLTPLIGEQNPEINLLLELLLLALVTFLNCRGTTTAGKVEFFLVLLKFIPLLIVPLCGLYYFNIDNFTTTENVASDDVIHTVAKVALLTFWGFIGLESGTTPADSVKNPSTTIPKAIIFGTCSVALLYLINTTSIMGLIPGVELSKSSAPYVESTKMLWGNGWDVAISVIASIICIGTLNAWTLTSGQIALGLAQDGLMPKAFGKKNAYDSPSFALMLSAIGIVPFLIMTSNTSISGQINQIIDFSVIAFLFVYLACAIALLKIILQAKERIALYELICTIIAIGFCVWVLYETPIFNIFIAGLFALSGFPVYLFLHKKTKY